ncbi:MAG: hypothetical protein KA817_10720 [Flavobacteriales bacterium]|nr:hypothetical protein [Flavobacteriales bacterium]
MNKGSVCFLLAGGIIGTAAGQGHAPVLRPQLGGTPDLSAEAHRLHAWYDSLLTAKRDIAPSEQAPFDRLFYAWGETYMGPCAIIGMECSWYCGGGPDTVWASSTLKPVGSHRYDALQAHDLDHCHAWAEGVPGPGIGESLTYRFANESPRLHTVNISNGLVTSEPAWRANNRVKRLRMDENGVPVAVLLLEDTMADQTFTLPRLFGQRVDHQPMRLSFTILDVYRGERYDDTVITEVWFDGTDVH